MITSASEPVRPEHLVHHLDELRAAGRLDEAAAICRRILFLDPSHAKADGLLSSLTGEPAEVLGAPGGLKPAPFVLVRELLARSDRDALVDRLRALADRFEPASMVTGRNDAHRKTRILPNCLPHLGEAVVHPLMRAIEGAVKGAIPKLRVAPFEPVFSETHALAYESGSFFGAHRDTGPANTRRITFVYHLQAAPFEGGDLLLYDTHFHPGHAAPPEGAPAYAPTATRLVSEDNRLVLFPSEFYHEVTPVSGAGALRLAINGWAHGTEEDGDLVRISHAIY